MYSDFFKYGRMLWEAKLVHLTSGNMSVRKGTAIYITRTGARLGDLTSQDIKQVNLENNLRDEGASSETPVHRAIYKTLPGVGAIIHAHPVYATVLSFALSEIIPVDSDSVCIPKVPVLRECPYAEGSSCVAEHFPALLEQHKVAAICGHGAFAVGVTLEECARWLSMMENSCQILFLKRLTEGGFRGTPK